MKLHDLLSTIELVSGGSGGGGRGGGGLYSPPPSARPVMNKITYE